MTEKVLLELRQLPTKCVPSVLQGSMIINQDIGQMNHISWQSNQYFEVFSSKKLCKLKPPVIARQKKQGQQTMTVVE